MLKRRARHEVITIGLFDSDIFGIESDSASWFWNRFLTVVFDYFFFRSKEPNLAMTTECKGRRK